MVNPHDLKVTELREELKNRGLDTKGLKKDLVERLESALKLEQESQPSNAPAQNSQAALNSTHDEVTEVSESIKGIDSHHKETIIENVDEREPKSPVIQSTQKLKDESHQQHGIIAEENILSDDKKRKLEENEDNRHKLSIQELPVAIPVKRSRLSDDEKLPNEVLSNITSCIHGKNFVMPFTFASAREYFSDYGGLLDFWMDEHRTTCFAIYENSVVAKQHYDSIHGKLWPAHGKVLELSFADETQARLNIEANRQKQVEQMRVADGFVGSSDARKGPSVVKSLDDLFRKTETQPALYYLPLSEKQIREKKSSV